jgi:hypothetical protein
MPVLILVAIAAVTLFIIYRFRIGPSAMPPLARLVIWSIWFIMVALVVAFYFIQGRPHA